MFSCNKHLARYKQHALLTHAETYIKVLLLHIHYFGLILTKKESANKFLAVLQIPYVLAVLQIPYVTQIHAESQVVTCGDTHMKRQTQKEGPTHTCTHTQSKQQS